MTEDKEFIRATRNQIEEFRSSMLWKDIVDELNNLDRRAQLEYDLVGEPHKNDDGLLVIPNTSDVLIHLGDIKGRRKAVQYFLQILDVFETILEEQANDAKRERADRSNPGE